MEGVIILGELLLLCCFHYITKLVLLYHVLVFWTYTLFLSRQDIAADIVNTRAHTPRVLFPFVINVLLFVLYSCQVNNMLSIIK
jgi:hypothetical protein